MKNTENWIVNEGTSPKHPKELSADDLIGVVYAGGMVDTGPARTWQAAWNSSHPSSFTIKQYRILNKASVMTRFFSFISENQNDPLVFVSALMFIVCLAGGTLSTIVYLMVEVSRWFAVLIPTLPLAYLIHRFRKAD